MLTNRSVGKYGRFGNMLFQVASCIGIARKSGQPYAFPPLINHDHKERFGSTEDVELDKYFVNPLPKLPADYPGLVKREYPWGYHDIHLPDGNWDLAGHFQSEKYFKHCIDEVRHYFTMVDEGPIVNSVAIHVRRGDYDNAYHPILGPDYYRKAMEIFPKGKTQFVVFSDDMAAVEEMFKLMGFPASSTMVFIKGRNYIHDFKMMKRFQDFIVGNSSFSLMAAMLGEHPDKKIVCPRNWFGPAWTIPMETKDIYPDNSIVI